MRLSQSCSHEVTSERWRSSLARSSGLETEEENSSVQGLFLNSYFENGEYLF